MKQSQKLRLRNVAMLFMILAKASVVSAQPPFEVPLRISDGLVSQILYFGLLPGGHYCFHPADSLNGHQECMNLPPPPPLGVFDARLVLPRVVFDSTCCAGAWYDYRPFIGMQRDTFRIRVQHSENAVALLASWPSGLSRYFTQLRLRYFNGIQNVNINMLIDTSVNFSDIEPTLPATFHIFSDIVGTGVHEQSKGNIYTSPVLRQNYPNPFNPSTVIKFQLPTSGFVRLKVYDVLGREVATLLEGERLADGHTVEWTPEGIPSGIYTYRLTTANTTFAKKMLYLK